MDSEMQERLKLKIQHVLDAVKALQELEKQVDLCIAHDVGPMESDPAGVRTDAGKAKKLLYHHLTELMAMLMKSQEASCFSLQVPQTERDMAFLKMVAEVLIGRSEEEEDAVAKKRHRFVKTDQDGIFSRCGKWFLGRAAVCGRELTAFCDVWVAISTVLLVVKLYQQFSSADMAELAREPREAMENVKDHISFTAKK
ncbi:hypothetical protein RchiOBHm_Chr5g0016511 [Rosa chinensis]|uniref:Uncharacterized protein n=1 Tax=Rosa chinensis TaxID=74649 RepID=A0A2P6Q688_ROSCH|nr:uncharacterized protein LOC112201659 [Rosa chinensis]PRQ29688.1 hypothetical protein RchiOBHm_Chr5g0016511 [Rosa chinensis]